MENNKEIKPQAVVELIEHGPIKITGNFRVNDLKRIKRISLRDMVVQMRQIK